MKGIDKLYLGDFNNMTQEHLPGGITKILLEKRGEHQQHQLLVRDLYGEHEEVLEDKVIAWKRPAWSIERERRARENAGKGTG